MTPDAISQRGFKVLYHTFGCKLNFAETASVADIFAARGHRAVERDEQPDIIVVNSCSVTAEADRKCRSTLRGFHRRYPDASILVTGCYAQLKPGEVGYIDGVKAVVGINDKLLLADIAEQLAEGTYTGAIAVPAKDLRGFMPSCSRGDRTRYFLKVQDGCDYWCSYCTIPRARGRSRSGNIEDIVAQAEKAANAGGREIVLTGVNIGDFGHGRDDNFLDLCMALDRIDGIERYRISSIEPNLLTDELMDFVAGSRAFMPHFHVPLQSGSDEVLRTMRRRYDTDFFRSKIERIRHTIPDAFIGIDLIVGARGETDELFEQSRQFVESLDVSHVHVFSYSERPDTQALKIDYIVPQEEKHRRSEVMHRVSAAKHAAFARRFEGSVRPVLIEHPHSDKPVGGFTDNYLRIETQLDASYDNKIVNLRLGNLMADGETLQATMLT